MSRLTHIFHNEFHNADFTMRVIGRGDLYGKTMALRHQQDDPLVEFYDGRQDTPGQFVSRYYLSTLLEEDRSGKTAFDGGLILDGGNNWRVDADGMKSCLVALQVAGMVPGDPDKIFEEHVKELAGKLNRAMSQRLEYAESHTDAGEAYAHLPREGTWQYNNGDKRLADYMRRTGLDPQGLEIEKLSDLVLDNFRMEPGNIFDPTYENDDLFLVDSFPVTEIEEQIDLKSLDHNATDAAWAEAMKVANAHFEDGRGYLASSSVWYALIDRESLKELIHDAAAELAQDGPGPG